MNRSIAFMFLPLFIFVCFAAGIAQDAKPPHSDETTAQVPILTEFHEVIFKVWHTAWPEKNTAMLVELLPEIRHYSDSIAKVQLPGILRDKEKVWKENTAKLQEIVTEYAKATSPIDSQKLLNAAEQLHAQFEKLVRITRPVLTEIEAFHQVLYMLYHHYLTDKDQEKIVSSVEELKEKMALLEKATLPERMKKKEAAFIEARTILSRSVNALDVSMVKDNPTEFAARVETMHSDYQAMEKVFE
jgi:hypothetical protein